MITVQQGVRPEAFEQRAEHTLFVEGKDSEAFDPVVIEALFRGRVRIKALGPASSIASVAKSLHVHHPCYYFLIDRDHHSPETVEQHWANFPDPDKHNLLIWRKRELESYFLLPEYIIHSPYLTVNEDELRECIRKNSQQRLFIDAANWVIIELRERVKSTAIPCFPVGNFLDRERAMHQLCDRLASISPLPRFQRDFTQAAIQQLYEQRLDLLTGGLDGLEYNRGEWLSLLSAKPIFHCVMEACFTVKNQGRVFQGKEKHHTIVKQLLQRELASQPDDFRQLHQLITQRIGQS